MKGRGKVDEFLGTRTRSFVFLWKSVGGIFDGRVKITRLRGEAIDYLEKDEIYLYIRRNTFP